MMAASEWLRPTTAVPPTAATTAAAEPGHGEFCLLTTPSSNDQVKAAVAASPPRDSFYDGMPDIERVFAVDNTLLQRRHVHDTRFFVGVISLQIVWQAISIALSDQRTSTVLAALLVLLITYLSLDRWVSHRRKWLDVGGRHVALTTSGTIRHDRANAVPVATTDHVRFFAFVGVVFFSSWFLVVFVMRCSSCVQRTGALLRRYFSMALVDADVDKTTNIFLFLLSLYN